MAEVNVAPQLNANSLVAIAPVTLDDEGNPATYGMPIYIKLSDLAAWIGDGGSLTLPAATTSAAGVVKQGAAVTNLTDNSGGTSGGNTIAATTDQASTSNAVATLAAKVNAILVALRTAGIIVT